MAEGVSVLIAEDQDIARFGLKMALGKVDGVTVIGEAADGESVVSMALDKRPNIIMMDIGLPIIDGIEATLKIKAAHPDTRIIMFTSDETDDTIFAALRAGADGYCLKKISSEQLSIAINSVMMGSPWLDPGVANRVLRAQIAQPQSPKPAPALESSQAQVEGDKAENTETIDKHVEVLNLVGKGIPKEQIAERLSMAQGEVESILRDILCGVLTDDKPDTLITASSLSGRVNTVTGLPSQHSREMDPGQLFAGKYRISSIVGEGGMSIVYDAQHEYMQKRVAIKILRENLTGHQDSLARFRREAQIMSAIQHANLVTVYDSGLTESGQPYIIMDYLDGMSLDEYIEDENPGVAELMSIFCQVCDALEAAHRKNLVHRDLKPSNIMLVADEEGNAVVKLVDFGIAKFTQDDPDMRLTQAGEVFGTPPFMSPEQCKGEDLDLRSDIYSLGCVMFEAFTGERAFASTNLYEVLTMHVTTYPDRAPFRRISSPLMSAMEALVFQCIEKDRTMRPPTALHVKRSLIEAYKANR